MKWFEGLFSLFAAAVAYFILYQYYGWQGTLTALAANIFINNALIAHRFALAKGTIK